MDPRSIGMIGAGAWGTAVAKVLAENGHQVQMWSYEQDVTHAINNSHENRTYLQGVMLPELIRASTNLSEVAESKDYLILAVPSLYLIETVKQMVRVSSVQEGSTPIAILTKGFIDGPGGPGLLTSAVENYLPGFYKDNLVYISGPSHAEEVARGKITGLISASKHAKYSIQFRELLRGPTLLVFSSLDIVGVQAAAALKNVVAIAFGMLDALKELNDKFGDNTESLLLAAGLNEIQLLGNALGASHPQTFTSIAAVGDLDVTCRSIYGRNRRFGREIIHERKISHFSNLQDILQHIEQIGYLPEGVAASKHAFSIAQSRKLKTPIINAVYNILNREAEPFEAIVDLLKKLSGVEADYFVDPEKTEL